MSEAINAISRKMNIPRVLLTEALAETNHYTVRRRRKPSKDSSGKWRYRVLHIPQPKLKEVQRLIHEWMMFQAFGTFLRAPAWDRGLHGFIAKRSHETAALSHLWSKAVFTVDFQDAFPTVRRAWLETALVLRLKFTREEAKILGQLTTYKGRLRQGAPSSPLLFNLVTLDLLEHLKRFAAEREYGVTIYADEVAVSSDQPIPKEDRTDILRLCLQAGFKVHPKKIRYHEAKWGAIELTGILLGPRSLGLSNRRYIDHVRSMIHRLVERGSPLTEKEREVVKGHLAWIAHIDPAKLQTRLAKPLEELRALRDRTEGVSSA